MNNNDVLRRLRYVYDYSDSTMIAIFRHAQLKVTRAELSAWLKKDEEEGFEECNDEQLATFLNGLIIEKRGAKEGPPAVIEKKLNNNLILKKLKIALNLRSDEMMEILTLAEFRVSKHELSAFFRAPAHKHYRECLDQFLRHFLGGMKLKYRDKNEVKTPFAWPEKTDAKSDTPNSPEAKS
ncbi:MAG: hypothetical protein COA42_10370 [Alteromonadaceae bacterium]|nr:MAG: hypothetical protein COA42_10370 [Alteromonadaceae bacterium]